MNNQDIAAEIGNFIAEEILKQPKRMIAEDESLISSGMVDSFNLVDLSIFVEERYGVRIDDTELNKETFDTINQLIELIHQRQ